MWRRFALAVRAVHRLLWTVLPLTTGLTWDDVLAQVGRGTQRWAALMC